MTEKVATQSIDIVRVILALIIPPVAVALQVGVTKHLWLNIVLTLFGFLPGVLHALYVVIKQPAAN